MKIKTKDFGIIEIDPSEIIRFPEGVYAFEDATEFILLQKDDCPAMWLQCCQEEDPRFIVFDPEDIVDGYAPRFGNDVLLKLQASSEKELILFTIAIVPENVRQTTVNLKSPIVINPQKKLGMQVVLEDSLYPLRYKLFSDGQPK